MKRISLCPVENTKTPNIKCCESGDPIDSIDDLPSRRKCSCELFKDYCENSTIHGVPYIGAPHQPPLNLLWWLLSFGISLVLCTILIYNVWIKWDTTPVILSFAEQPTTVWEIPFPAVTICPDIKAEKKLFNITDIYQRLSEAAKNNVDHDLSLDELKTYEAITQVCEEDLSNFSVGNLVADGRSIAEILDRVKVKMSNELFYCKWRNEFENCTSILSSVLTEEGHCYTFNIMDQKDVFRMENMHQDHKYTLPTDQKRNQEGGDIWDLDNGYSDERSAQTYPFRVMSSGSRAGLTVLVTLFEKDSDFICRGDHQGFRVHLHTPREFPSFSNQYIQVPVNQEFIALVSPKIITTTEELRNYHPTRRQCFFGNERYLRFFQMYTQQNCEIECLANYTLSACGCVKFSMPRDAKTPVCGSNSVACFKQAEEDLFYHNSFERDSQDKRAGCNCLPSCNSIVYDVETSQAKYEWQNIFKAFGNPIDEFPGVQFLRFSIQFKETQFISSKRTELYGVTDFLANCGGLLGLFMGVSLLSIVQIIYYCSVKVCLLGKKEKYDIN